jgi:hypothetical protein
VKQNAVQHIDSPQTQNHLEEAVLSHNQGNEKLGIWI